MYINNVLWHGCSNNSITMQSDSSDFFEPELTTLDAGGSILLSSLTRNWTLVCECHSTPFTFPY